MAWQPRCDSCGRFFIPGPGSSWVFVPAIDVPGEYGDERERCKQCTDRIGPAVCAPKYRADRCCGVIEDPRDAG